MEDVIRQMRRDIRIEPVSGMAFRLSFVYPDPRKAQQVTTKLMQHLLGPNFRMQLLAAHTKDQMSTASDDEKFAFRLHVIDPPDLPGPGTLLCRVSLMAAGLGGGLLLGYCVSLLRRRSAQAAA